MGNLQVKNVPEQLSRRLRRYAKQQQRSIRDIVLEAVQRELERRAFVDRLHERSRVTLRSSPAELLAAERSEREREL
jgi:plasmid stability protein